MKARELREKSTGELQALEKELREQLFRLKMQHFTGQLETVSDLKSTRRKIATVLTVLRDRAA